MSKRKAPSGISGSNVNAEICDMLNELANYEKNVNRQVYKYNAYRKASSAISKHPIKITNGKEAKSLEGVGDKIAKKIDELLTTGKLAKLEKIQGDETSVAINLLSKVPGIGPVLAHKLVDKGVKSIEELREHENELNKYQKVGLKYYDDLQNRIPRQEMVEIENQVCTEISAVSSEYKSIVCGSYRRGAATCGDADIIITHPKYTIDNKKTGPKLLNDVITKLEKEGLIKDEFVHGEMKYSGIIKLENYEMHRQIDIRQMRGRALEKGFTLNEYSIRKVGATGEPGEPLEVESEQNVFEYIDMSYVKPSDRSM